MQNRGWPSGCGGKVHPLSFGGLGFASLDRSKNRTIHFKQS